MINHNCWFLDWFQNACKTKNVPLRLLSSFLVLIDCPENISDQSISDLDSSRDSNIDSKSIFCNKCSKYINNRKKYEIKPFPRFLLLSSDHMFNPENPSKKRDEKSLRFFGSSGQNLPFSQSKYFFHFYFSNFGPNCVNIIIST